jgi:hypothetical protein
MRWKSSPPYDCAAKPLTGRKSQSDSEYKRGIANEANANKSIPLFTYAAFLVRSQPKGYPMQEQQNIDLVKKLYGAARGD